MLRLPVCRYLQSRSCKGECRRSTKWLISERFLVTGAPGKIKRTFTEEELRRQKKNAAVCMDGACEYANSVKIVG